MPQEILSSTFLNMGFFFPYWINIQIKKIYILKKDYAVIV